MSAIKVISILIFCLIQYSLSSVACSNANAAVSVLETTVVLCDGLKICQQSCSERILGLECDTFSDPSNKHDKTSLQFPVDILLESHFGLDTPYVLACVTGTAMKGKMKKQLKAFSEESVDATEFESPEIIKNDLMSLSKTPEFVGFWSNVGEKCKKEVAGFWPVDRVLADFINYPFTNTTQALIQSVNLKTDRPVETKVGKFDAFFNKLAHYVTYKKFDRCLCSSIRDSIDTGITPDGAQHKINTKINRQSMQTATSTLREVCLEKYGPKKGNLCGILGKGTVKRTSKIKAELIMIERNFEIKITRVTKKLKSITPKEKQDKDVADFEKLLAKYQELNKYVVAVVEKKEQEKVENTLEATPLFVDYAKLARGKGNFKGNVGKGNFKGNQNFGKGSVGNLKGNVGKESFGNGKRNLKFKNGNGKRFGGKLGGLLGKVVEDVQKIVEGLWGDRDYSEVKNRRDCFAALYDLEKKFTRYEDSLGNVKDFTDQFTHGGNLGDEKDNHKGHKDGDRKDGDRKEGDRKEGDHKGRGVLEVTPEETLENIHELDVYEEDDF